MELVGFIAKAATFRGPTFQGDAVFFSGRGLNGGFPRLVARKRAATFDDRVPAHICLRVALAVEPFVALTPR